MKSTFPFLNNPYIIVGVSGGPDSMALLNKLRLREIFNIVVVHINYHKRASADRDQKIVEEYCQTNNLSLVVYDGSELPKGNFQQEARKFRLQCFKEVYDGYQAKALYLAHHQDDNLETIVYELTTKRQPDYLGIKPSNWVDGMLIKRPLLNESKQSLIEYCQKQGIDYGLDETNEQPLYRRNVIRQQLKELSEKDKEMLLDYQAIWHKKDKIYKHKAQEHLKKFKKQIDIESFLLLDKPIQTQIVRFFFKDKNVSQGLVQEFIKQAKQDRNFISHMKDEIVSFEYGKAVIVKPIQYSVSLNEFQKINHKYFKLNEDRGTGLVLKPEDFPITIRNAQAKDKIDLNYGTKAINRFFIDRKIPFSKRIKWPVIENKEGTVICVFGLGCDVDHYGEYNAYLSMK